MLANEFSKPEVRKTIETLWKISDFYKEKNRKFAEAVKELSELGYPDLSGGSMEVPFDNYSDNYRGTILSLEDIYANDDVVIRYTEDFHQKQLAKIRNMNKDGSKNGKYVSDMLHKGMDGFMSDEVYEKFYWRHLYEMMETVIECGMIPMLFCEGKYDSRIKFLKDAPKGRKLYRFERIDMKAAKAAIGNNACLGGAFPSQLLQFGTKEQVVEETKRLLGEAMPGGGYIFRCSAGLDGGKVENVIAMFETVREYGKY